jgi:hypothetical protein
MKNIARALCIAVFLVGLMVFSLAQSNNQAQTSSKGDEVEPARSFVVKMIQYRVKPDGSKEMLSRYTVYEKANGEGRRISYGPSGPKPDNPLSKNSNELTIDAILSDGFYSKAAGSNTLTYISGKTDEKTLEYFRSHKYLRDVRSFVRMDKVLGLEVYVLREEITMPVREIEWIEYSYSPKMELIAPRRVIHYLDGSEVIAEAVSIEFKDVPEDLNDDLKDLPINNLEEKLQKQRQN